MILIKSPFIIFLSVLLSRTLRIKESGVQDKLWKDVYVSKPKCSQQGNFIPLALMDVSPVIFAFMGGVALSLTVFAMEILYHKYANKASSSSSSVVFLQDPEKVIYEGWSN